MLKKIFFSFQTNMLLAILNLFLTVLTAKYLGSSGRGELTIIVTYIAFIQVINEIAGSNNVFYLLNKYRVSEIFLMSYVWYFLISLASAFFLKELNLIGEDVFIIVLFSSLFLAIQNLQLKVLLNKSKLILYNLSILLQPTLIIFFVILLGFNNLDIISFLKFQLYSYIITAIISFGLLYAKNIEKIRYNYFKKLIFDSFKLGAINQSANFSQILNYRLAYLYLQKYSGINSVGVFSLVLSVVNVIWLFSTTIATLLSNEVAKSTSAIDKISLTNKALKITLLMTLLITIGVVFLPVEFYLYLFNKDFIELKRLVIIMSPAIIIFSTARIIAHYFSGLGLMKYNFISSFSGLIITIVFAPVLIEKYNLIGAVISNSLSYILSTLILVYIFRNRKFHYLNK